MNHQTPPSRTLDQLDTFAMAMLAAIGELPDTIMDRAVVIRMRRRAPGERVQPYRTRRDAPPLNQLRELQHATPAMPLEDRAADTWEPLVAIADLAGGDWPARARDAAATMTAAEVQQEEDTSASVRLLSDLREVFGAADALYTTTILEALHKLEDAPWPDWYGRPLSTRDLAKLLRPYDIRSKSVREHGTGPPSRAMPAPTSTTPGSATPPQRHKRHIRHTTANAQLRRILGMWRKETRCPTHATQTAATWRMCRRSWRRPPQGRAGMCPMWRTWRTPRPQAAMAGATTSPWCPASPAGSAPPTAPPPVAPSTSPVPTPSCPTTPTARRTTKG